MKNRCSALLFCLFVFPTVAHAQTKDRAPADRRAAEPKAAPAKPGRVVVQGTQCRPAAESDRVTLDFDHAPLSDLVREVGRALCRNFVVEPALARHPVFVAANAGTSMKELWPMFLSILAAHELTIIDHGAHHTIIPAIDGTRSKIPTYGPKDEVPSEERMVTKVFELKDKDINAVTNFVNIYKSPKGQVHPFASSGIIVMTDFASSVTKIEWLLAQMAPANK